MKQQNYTKLEIDLLFEKIGLMFKNELGPIKDKVDAIDEKVKSYSETHALFANDLTEQKEQVLSARNLTKGAIWAFGITLPIIIGILVYVFFNEIEHMKENISVYTNNSTYYGTK